MTPYRHIPAMPREVASFLDCSPGDVVVDCTLGGSGHAREICGNILPDGLLVGIDQDMDAIRNAETTLAPFAANIRLFHGPFTRLPEFLSQLGLDSVDAILMDLGLSLHHIEGSGRGFSFQKDEPLDMRMNQEGRTRAESLVNRLNARELEKIFKEYGEERWSRAIARHIVRERKKESIRTTGRLARIIRAAVPGKAAAASRIHPATRVFMALRIAVNRELDRLQRFLEFAPDLLNPGGRLCVLSFHSLEDRIVKRRFKALEKGCTCPPAFPVCACGREPMVRLLTRKTVRPGADEIAANPMARSTRLRACEKLPGRARASE